MAEPVIASPLSIHTWPFLPSTALLHSLRLYQTILAARASEEMVLEVNGLDDRQPLSSEIEVQLVFPNVVRHYRSCVVENFNRNADVIKSTTRATVTCFGEDDRPIRQNNFQPYTLVDGRGSLDP